MAVCVVLAVRIARVASDDVNLIIDTDMSIGTLPSHLSCRAAPQPKHPSYRIP